MKPVFRVYYLCSFINASTLNSIIEQYETMKDKQLMQLKNISKHIMFLTTKGKISSQFILNSLIVYNIFTFFFSCKIFV